MTLTYHDTKYLACVGRAGEKGIQQTEVARELNVGLKIAGVYLDCLTLTKHLNLVKGRYYITPKGSTALGRAPQQQELIR